MADFTRSLASCTAASGRPTIIVFGKPPETSTSTSTKAADNPTKVAEKTFAVIKPSVYFLIERALVHPPMNRTLYDLFNTLPGKVNRLFQSLLHISHLAFKDGHVAFFLLA